MTGAAFLDELRASLPDMHLVTDRAGMEPFRRDQTAYLRAGHPLGVAFPTSTREVSTVVGLASRHRVPVVPRGAGSGLSGGAAAATPTG